MKIKYEQLTQHLKNNLTPIYLLSGEEPLLIQEANAQIIKCANKQGFSAQSRLFADKNFDWQNLLIEMNNLALFSEKTIINLNLPTGKPGEKGSKILQNYAQNPPTDKLLLINTGKLDMAAQKSKWVQAIEKAGIFMQIWPIDRMNLPTWISSRMQQIGLKTNIEALNLLAEHVEGNLLAAMQEIEKLRLLYGTGILTTGQIITAIADNAKFNIFDLANAIKQRNNKKALRILHSLQHDKTEPILVLWVIAKLIRDSKTALPMLQHCAKIDRIIKGAEPGNIWNELERLCLKLSAS